jgi:hypothetical protein
VHRAYASAVNRIFYITARVRSGDRAMMETHHETAPAQPLFGWAGA